MRHLSSYALAAALVLSTQSLALADGTIEVIDFEEYLESTQIGLQYKAQFGVEFSLVGGGLPIIVEEGTPLVAFGSAFSDGDAYMSSGARGLTDPVGANGYAASPKTIRIDFDPPVTFVSLFLIDIDFVNAADLVVVTAYSGESVVDSETTTGVAANDGKSIPVAVNGASITSVTVQPSSGNGLIGWAMDFLTFSRPCAIPGCTQRFRLSQESSPGANDFSSHILGEIPIWSAPGTTAGAFYGYGVPEGSSWNGAALSPQLEQSHLFGAVTKEGPTLFLVHDRYGGDANVVSGETGVRLDVVNDPNGAMFAVKDDPNDIYTGVDGSIEFTAQHIWWKCCTDGLALGDLACGSTVFVEFSNVDNDPMTPVISGLTDWVAYGADGSQIPLALAADRRVRVDLLPPASCPADFTCDGVIGAADLGVLLGAWGQTFGAPDIDGSGLVDATDLAALLGLWGSCP